MSVSDISENKKFQKTRKINNRVQKKLNVEPMQEVETNTTDKIEENIKTEKQEEIIFNLKKLKEKDVPSLIELASEFGIENSARFSKDELIFIILKKISESGGVTIAKGTLEKMQEDYGFLRDPNNSFSQSICDIYLPSHFIKKLGIRSGDEVEGKLRPPRKGERYFAISEVISVGGVNAKQIRYRVSFDDLTPVYPNSPLTLEIEDGSKKDLSGRIIDIVAPLGKGQRALIVAPPRAGKTVLLQKIADSISTNNPSIKLIVLLIGERPEEVTDMQRSVKGEVISSTFDEPCAKHIQISEMAIEKAKRLVEEKQDVVVILDSITRLARAYNNAAPSSGKVLTGGVDSNALQRPKRLFGAARNIEEGGSLTIIASALIETGSRMDEVIFEEFKGTGNAEIVLDRKSADKRVFPSIDIAKSGTRKEELLLDQSILPKYWILRKILSPMGTTDALEFLIEKLSQSKTNKQFFLDMGKHNKK